MMPCYKLKCIPKLSVAGFRGSSGGRAHVDFEEQEEAVSCCKKLHHTQIHTRNEICATQSKKYYHMAIGN